MLTSEGNKFSGSEIPAEVMLADVYKCRARCFV